MFKIATSPPFAVREKDYADVVYRYQVIQRDWLFYTVEEVRISSISVARRKLRTFLKLKNAEACAHGLAYGTWTIDGPIMAEFTPPTPTEVTDDELPD